MPPGGDYQEIAQVLHAFAGRSVTMKFKLLGPANRFYLAAKVVRLLVIDGPLRSLAFAKADL
jgi:hypothetical protein